jgi:hypothetical protein
MSESLSKLANALGIYFQPKRPTQSVAIVEPMVTEPMAVPTVVDEIVTYVLPRSLDAVCQKANAQPTAACNTAIQALRQTVQAKLSETHTEVALTLAQSDPTSVHQQVLKAELQRQMEMDASFADRLQALLQQVHEATPALKTALHALHMAPAPTLVAEAERLANQLLV